MNRKIVRSMLAIAAALLLISCASTTKPGTVGITRQQFLLIPAATVEKMALASYAQQNQKASQNGKLITSGADYDRLLAISKRIRMHTPVFRDDTAQWKWQLALIDAPDINATCAPGGKITFYTGILKQLQLTDDEIAAVMGHEIAHALREHGRERISQAFAANTITQAALINSSNPQAQAMLATQFTKYLFLLPNSRENESEADGIGLELAARAGYDPNAAITLWKKMSAASEQKAPEFMSTHPSNDKRIGELSALIPRVMPLYLAAKQP